MLHLNCFWLLGCGDIALFLGSSVVNYLVIFDLPRLGLNTPSTELFSKKKNHVLLSKFFSSLNMFFIRLFLAIKWKNKIEGHRACFLTNCRERWARFFRSQSGWRICAAGTRTKHKIKPIVFEVCTRDQACFRLLLCAWYRQHRNSYLDRVQQIPWNGVSQDLMRFWSYESLFWTIL